MTTSLFLASIATQCSHFNLIIERKSVSFNCPPLLSHNLTRVFSSRPEGPPTMEQLYKLQVFFTPPHNREFPRFPCNVKDLYKHGIITVTRCSEHVAYQQWRDRICKSRQRVSYDVTSYHVKSHHDTWRVSIRIHITLGTNRKGPGYVADRAEQTWGRVSSQHHCFPLLSTQTRPVKTIRSLKLQGYKKSSAARFLHWKLTLEYNQLKQLKGIWLKQNGNHERPLWSVKMKEKNRENGERIWLWWFIEVW